MITLYNFIENTIDDITTTHYEPNVCYWIINNYNLRVVCDFFEENNINIDILDLFRNNSSQLTKFNVEYVNNLFKILKDEKDNYVSQKVFDNFKLFVMQYIRDYFIYVRLNILKLHNLYFYTIGFREHYYYTNVTYQLNVQNLNKLQDVGFSHPNISNYLTYVEIANYNYIINQYSELEDNVIFQQNQTIIFNCMNLFSIREFDLKSNFDEILEYEKLKNALISDLNRFENYHLLDDDEYHRVTYQAEIEFISDYIKDIATYLNDNYYETLQKYEQNAHIIAQIIVNDFVEKNWLQIECHSPNRCYAYYAYNRPNLETIFKTHSEEGEQLLYNYLINLA